MTAMGRSSVYSGPDVRPLLNGERLVFVGGLHRSGTSLVHRCLSDHSEVSGFRNTGVPEDEGQHLQWVYPPAAAHGGSGRFGFDSASFLDESSPLVSSVNTERLLRDWARHWDLAKGVLIEKSPPNLVRTRFLQALYPASSFVIVLRHPVVVGYATQKWTPDLRIGTLIDHWLRCHERFVVDRPSLRKVHVLRYEDFVASPEEHLRSLQAFLGLRPEPLRREVRSDVNNRYWALWERRGRGLFTRRYVQNVIARFEDRVAALGYSLRAPA